MIRFDSVSYSYKTKTGETEALKNVSFTIPSGSFTAVIGPNGCGKSTLALLAASLLLPSSGKVTVDGTDSAETTEIHKKVGIVFQNPDNQIVGDCVEDDVIFGPENLGLPPEEIGQRLKTALAVTGLSDYRFSPVSSLSGGQKLKLAIAGILALESKYIVLDEPFSMLDSETGTAVLKYLHQLNRDRGVTVILVTHNTADCTGADRLILLQNGSVAFSGTPSEVFFSGPFAGSGLELPPAAALAARLRAKGIPLAQGITDATALASELNRLRRQEP